MVWLCHVFAVDDKAGVFCDLVIEAARGGVALMREPVDAEGSGFFCCTVYSFNELAADAVAAKGLVCEEVVEIAGGLDGKRGAVEEIVDEADELSVLLCDQGVHGFTGIEEAGPGCLGDGFRKSCGSVAAVEGIVAEPEGKPLLVIVGADGADGEFRAHEADSLAAVCWHSVERGGYWWYGDVARS